MSEPVTNAEVEDVLSSIRRLVSEEKRTRHPAEQPQGGDKLVLTPSQRVAEPSSGMDQDTVGEAAKQLFDPQDDLPTDVYSRDHGHDMGWEGNDTAFFDDLGDAQIAPDEETFVTSVPEEAAPQEAAIVDHADDYRDDPYGFAEEERGETAQQPSRVTLIDPLGASGFDPIEDDSAFSEGAEDGEAQADPDAAAASEDEMFDFDALKSRHGQESEGAQDSASAEDAAQADVMPQPEEPQPQDEGPSASEVATSKAATLSAKIAALETAIGNIADTWEPDTPGTDDYSGTDQPAMAWEDDVSRDATGVPLRGETVSAPWQEAHPDVVMIGTARAAANAAAAAAAREAEAAESVVPEVETPSPEEIAAAEHQAAKDRAIAAARAAAAERLAADRRAAEHHAQSMAAAAETAAPEVTAPTEPAQSVAEAEESGEESQLLDEETLRVIVSEIVRSELQGALGERITRNVRKLVRREIHRALTAQELE